MNKGVVLLFVGGAAAAVASYVMVKQAKKLENLVLDANLGSFSFADTNKTNIALRMSILVYNPNLEDLPFESFTGNFFFKGSSISNIDSFTDKSIVFKARATTSIPLKASIPITSFATSVIDVLSNLLTSNKTPLAILLKGNLKAVGMTLPIEKTFTLNMPV